MDKLDGVVEWGELLQNEEDIFVARARLRDEDVVIKRFRLEGDRREIETYQLLARLGVPTLRLVDHGSDWLALEDIAHSEWREATVADLDDPAFATNLARWYAKLHTQGREAAEVPTYDEVKLVTPDTVKAVAARWPQLAPGLDVVLSQLDELHRRYEELDKTLTYNDFAQTNALVARDGTAAAMYDYNLLGRGYRYADVRNVVTGLGPAAHGAFLDEYLALTGEIDPREVAVDTPLSHLVTVVFADLRGYDKIPAWAQPSADWVQALVR